MKDIPLIFVHGWGCGPDIWDGVIAQLPELECQVIDLGFTGEATDLDTIASKGAVFVTHSLGTMWVLENMGNSMAGLVAINGFACFQKFSEKRVLQRMKIGLQRDVQVQMDTFWEATDLLKSATLHSDALDEGLSWLMDWDCTDNLSKLSTPALSVIGQSDPLLDYESMLAHWAGFEQRVIEGKHNLPLSQPEACADIIKGAVRAL